MTDECRPPATTRCWFCDTGRGPICDPCIDGADAELDAHFATPPGTPADE